MFASTSAAVTTLVVTSSLSLLSKPGYALTAHRFSRVTRNVPPQNGNTNAAGDLYGLGMRLGVYLQVFGMLLYCLGSHHRSRTGIKLLSSAVCLAFLSSWTALVSREQISPSEAWLVLSLVNAYAAPRLPAIKHWDKSGGGGVAYAFSAISVVWESFAFVWLFAARVRQLPLLGTKDRVWLFTAVDVTGWFRILMLIYSAVCCASLFVQVPEYLCLFHDAFCEWAGTSEENENEDEDEELEVIGAQSTNSAILVPDKRWTWGWLARKLANTSKYVAKNPLFNEIKDRKFRLCMKLFGIKKDMPIAEEQHRWTRGENFFRTFWVSWGLLILVLTIAGVEKIIEYNALSPQNDLSQPGQMIPLVLGIITLIEGAASACMPQRPITSGPIASNDIDRLLEVDGELEEEDHNVGALRRIQERMKASLAPADHGKEGDEP